MFALSYLRIACSYIAGLPVCSMLFVILPFLGDDIATFQKEFLGTIAMIALTFSPGTWVGTSTATVYLLHAAGVITADRFFGGDVNPAVSFCMYSLGKFKLRSFVTKISAQLLGGLVAFFLFSYLATTFSLPQFGGPSLPRYKTDDAVEVCFMNELTGTFLLLTTIFTVNWEIVFLAVPDQNYFIKQTLTAFVIRLLIMTFPNSGPALNPMLATAYAVHENTKIDDVHILVYWVAPILGGCLAAVGYVFYTGGEGAQFFGYDLKFAPRDKTKPVLNIAPIKAIPNTAPPKKSSTPEPDSVAAPPPITKTPTKESSPNKTANPATWFGGGKKKKA